MKWEPISMLDYVKPYVESILWSYTKYTKGLRLLDVELQSQVGEFQNSSEFWSLY